MSRWPTQHADTDPSLRRCLHKWLRHRGLPPLHYLVEPETLGSLGDRVVFLAAQLGHPVGNLVLSPIPARRGWLVEQIIRGNAAPNGTGTLLLDAAMHYAIDAGSTYLTLGLSPLSPHGPASSPNTLWLRVLLGWLRAHGRRFCDFRGLGAFKSKYLPDRWDPITTIAKEPRPHPGTLYAIADAFSGECSPVDLIGKAFLNALQDSSWTLRRRLSS